MNYANVARMLHDHLGPRPDQEALVFEDRRYTFAELERCVDRTAHALSQAGIRRGDRAALLAGTSDHYVIAMFALAKLGAIAVPLNVRWAADEIAYALDDVTPALLLIDAEHSELAGTGAARAAGAPAALDLHAPPGRDSLAARAAAITAAPLPYADVELDDPHRILYTSGTTSRPKGALHTHGCSAWNHRAMAADADLRPGDRLLVSYPMFHVSGLEAPGVFAALSAGVTCVLLDGGDAGTVLDVLERERITLTVLLPPLYDEVLSASPDRDLRALRWIITGAVTPALMRRFTEMLPGKRLIEVFAMTEATGPLTLLDEAHMVEKAGRTGRAVRNVELRIVDEQGQPVPAGTTGFVQARGPKLSPGYWGTLEPVRPDPARWFDTGDLGSLDSDGYLGYHGRAKEVIKSGGENVSMAEIERVLGQHPGIQAACIVRITHPTWGEVPKAYVLLREGTQADADELEAWCRASLAGFKVPRTWEFVDDLPFNHSGKVLRRVLQDHENTRTAPP
ncbi:AMP-binding protein [Actinomadura sp. 7K507]|uniref:class I adenylate-forming enzyme family protein n=1 Tax=Actinomadura sp. 7K507 TaxID=2530365 RepID=UPI001053510B|nr:AMP-binding protein [Actinomadura sp. 7K507]TDC92274.1 fatty-acyl-CoA synthase [Actinomadura sp. 7K507]